MTRWFERLFEPEPTGPGGHLCARWLWLRGLGVIFFSAFYSLAFQIQGLIGPRGILPAQELLAFYRTHQPGLLRFWEVPSLLWVSAGGGALWRLGGLGLLAVALLVGTGWAGLCLECRDGPVAVFVAAVRRY